MTEKPKSSLSAFCLFCSLVVSLGGFLFGYTTGVISGALLFITKQLQMSVFEQSLIVSILLIGGLIGSLVSGFFADKYGRKNALFLSVFFFLLGTLFLYVADSKIELIAGRFLTGIAVGIVSVVPALYLAEIAPANHRGALVFFNQLATSVGILASYLVNLFFTNNGSWQVMFGFAFFPTFVLFFALFFIPETPAFLAAHGELEKAKKIIKKVHPFVETEEIFLHVQFIKKQDADFSRLFSKTLRLALWIGVGLSFFQQMTGINTVVYYTPKILQIAGFDSERFIVGITVGIGIMNIFLAFFAIWLVDHVGRRKLLLVGLLGLTISLTFLSLAFLFSLSGIFVIGLILVYGAFFSISLGPLVGLINAEIYPLELRGKAMGFALFVNWICNFLISLTFLPLVTHFGTFGTFLLYACIALFGFWFSFRYVPETKGKTLEEIQQFWIKKKNPFEDKE